MNIVIKIIIIVLLIKIMLDAMYNYTITTLYNTVYNGISINKEEFYSYIQTHIDYFKNKNLEDLEYITKKDIFDNNELFINKNTKLINSSKLTGHNDWNDYAKANIVNNQLTFIEVINYIYLLLNGYAIAQISGGSSGNYFFQWFTLDEYIKGSYGFIKSWINLGWKPKDKILLFYKHGANSVKLLNYLNILDKFKTFDVDISDNDISHDNLINFINKINTFKPDLLVTFPNLLFRIAQLLYHNNVELEHYPKYIDISADFLFTSQYNFIKSIFKNSIVRMSYGTIEYGQIAQQIEGSMFDYIVFDEFIDVENDNEGNIVVTNYLLKTLPIIKYKTDDKGTVVKENGKTIIKNLVGKNKSNYNFVEIDNYINNSNYTIINLRIDDENKKVFVTVLEHIDGVEEYIGEYFKNYTINVVLCDMDICLSNDDFRKKHNPVL